MFEWNTASPHDKVSWLGLRLQSQIPTLTQLENYFEGTQPAAFLAPELVEQLQNRVASLNVNYCRLLTQTLVERITVTGFSVDGQLDARVWDVWKRNQMRQEQDWLLRDTIALGRGYLLVWVDSTGRPTISVESPRQVISYRNPVTREIEGALKQWSTFDDVVNVYTAWSVLYLPEEIITFSSVSPAAVNSIPSTGWKMTARVPNPLGVVPMVEFTNRTNVLDFMGSSEYAPIMGLQDSLNKTLLDAMTASEFGAFQRRWATGLSLQEDADGNVITPFGTKWNDIWQSDSGETKFGSFPAQSLTGFDVQANLLTRSISAISGLPEYLTGSGAANPTSADAIRASEISMTSKAQQKCDLFAPSFGRVAALALAIIDKRRAPATLVEPVYADLENRSEAMSTDAFNKLVAAGVPLPIAAKRALGWTDEECAELQNYSQNNQDLGNNNERTNPVAA